MTDNTSSFTNHTSGRNLSQKTLEIEVQKLKQAQLRQEEFFHEQRQSSIQSHELKSLAQDIIRTVEKAIPRLQDAHPTPESPSTVGSRSPTTSPQSEIYFLTTPPSTPHQSDRDRLKLSQKSRRYQYQDRKFTEGKLDQNHL